MNSCKFSSPVSQVIEWRDNMVMIRPIIISTFLLDDVHIFPVKQSFNCQMGQTVSVNHRILIFTCLVI